MATTYEAIATVTVGSGGAATIDIQSIPSTYTDLKLVYSLRNTADNPNFTFTFNNSSSNLSDTVLSGNGASATSFTDAAVIYSLSCRSTNTASTFGNGDIYIPNYAGSSNKSMSIDAVTENNATEAFAYLVAGLRSNTAAIDRITLNPSAGDFAQHSTATLYGIKNS